MRGILNVNKQEGWTSFDVVNYLKRNLHFRQIGHLGTLDPMATGVLPITIGSATKLFDMFLNKTKTYIAKFEFGYLTDTLDATGKILETTTSLPTEEQIRAILGDFIGEIEQMPPQFSAKKVNGKKACDIARNGGVVELKPKKILIKDIKFIAYANNVLELEIECGAGTYIRAIGRDIAEKLSSLATMTKLTRTKVGVFSIENAVNIKELDLSTINSKIMPIDTVFSYLEPIKDENIVKRLLNGQIVPTDLKNGDYRLYLSDNFVAIATVFDKKIKMSKYFDGVDY